MGKTVLVTGAEGFIGSHLVEHLIAHDYQVRAFVWYNSFQQAGWLDSLSPAIRRHLEIYWGDIRDKQQVMKAAEGQASIIHLAALIGIPYSYQAPQSYLDTNVSGTLNVLEAARHHQTERVLITSTSEVYGTALFSPITETHPLQPQSPYSASKIAADSLAMSYYYSFELPVTVVRPFNTYGPRQSQRAIIPTVICQLLNEQNPLMLGDLRPERDLCYVKDTVEGFKKILETPTTVGQTLNIATSQAYSMQEVVRHLIEQIHPHTRIEKDPSRIRPVQSEVQRLCGDSTALQTLTGWHPAFDLKSGLAETISWFRERPALWGSGDYTV